VCINVDKKWFTKHDVAVPQTLDDLTKPAYESTLVVENAATSSPGLAFVLASIARYGENGWRDYWQKLRDNGVKVVDDWTAAFEGEFSQGGNKGYPLVVSYVEPPVAVYFTKPQPATSPIGTMLDSCFQQVEFAGVLAGTEHRDAARQLVDSCCRRFQADIPLQMFVFLGP
jgi:thiamine transport system substrate-binding protein